jgi:hypothetical protein
MDNYNPSPQEIYYQGAQDEAQKNDPNAMYADYMREDKVKNIIQQLNPDNLVEDIEHRIRGEKKNRMSGEWELINKTNPRRVSELLLERYISFLSSLLNQNTALSNFSTKEINNLMQMVVEYIRDDLSDNADDYGFVMQNVIEVDTEVKLLKRNMKLDGTVEIQYIPKKIKKEIITEEVVDFNEMTRIGMIIAGTTFAVLKRAQNGMEARRIFAGLKVSESLNQPNQKRGITDILKFWQ